MTPWGPSGPQAILGSKKTPLRLGRYIRWGPFVPHCDYDDIENLWGPFGPHLDYDVGILMRDLGGF